jgi:hypothetical protein
LSCRLYYKSLLVLVGVVEEGIAHKGYYDKMISTTNLLLSCYKTCLAFQRQRKSQEQEQRHRKEPQHQKVDLVLVMVAFHPLGLWVSSATQRTGKTDRELGVAIFAWAKK